MWSFDMQLSHDLRSVKRIAYFEHIVVWKGLSTTDFTEPFHNDIVPSSVGVLALVLEYNSSTRRYSALRPTRLKVLEN